MRILVVLLLTGALLAQAPKLAPDATVKQVMQELTIPASTALFNAGLDEPPKEKDWAELKVQADVLLESGKQLLAPGRAMDQGDWVQAVQKLTAAAGAAQQAIAAKDLDKLQLDIADQLLMACSSCHEKYIEEQ